MSNISSEVVLEDISGNINSLECGKCLKVFASKGTYNLHLKTSKCSRKSSLKNTNTTEFKCQYCDKNFSSNQMLSYHTSICCDKKIYDLKTRYEFEINDLKTQHQYITNEYEIEIERYKKILQEKGYV